jgi:hypothetical protein
MSRRAAQVTQVDVARVMRAAEQAWPDRGFRVRVVANEIVVERMAEAAQPSPGLSPAAIAPKKDWRL